MSVIISSFYQCAVVHFCSILITMKYLPTDLLSVLIINIIQIIQMTNCFNIFYVLSAWSSSRLIDQEVEVFVVLGLILCEIVLSQNIFLCGSIFESQSIWVQH